MSQSPHVPAAVVDALQSARHVVVLTGAGVSAPSGIPTFRDAQSGLWGKFDPAEFATPEAFAADPQKVTQWYDQRRIDMLGRKPNAAHVALARIERKISGADRCFTLLTQNVDRLHQRAGSRNVHELHGSLLVWRCTETGREREYTDPTPFSEYPPPGEAGGMLRPAVVWFGEMLPAAVLQTADRALRDCDLFFSIGTSSVVHPAAAFIDLARSVGARTCEINLEETPITAAVDFSIQAPCDTALPILAAALA